MSWVLKDVPDLREIVTLRSVVNDYRANTLQCFELCKKINDNEEESKKLIKQLESSEDSSEKTTLCSKLEKLMSKNATLSSEIVQLLKPDIASKEMIIFADSNNSIREVLRQHQQMADFGNQTSLVATPNASEKDPNETVIDTSKSNPKSHLDNIEVFSKKSAAGQSQRTSKAASQSSKRREVEELEREKLIAKQKADQRLREREMQLKNERDKMELERQHQELEMRQRERT